MRDELVAMIDLAKSGALFDDAAFGDVPGALRRINDIAFSGDGEPTTCQHFTECVRIAAEVKRDANLPGVKIVLITDACYLTRPEVEAGLTIMDENNGEIWAKLDAGTEDYYQRVNRPNYPLAHVMANIIAASRVRPLVIQSLFMRLDGIPPGEAELSSFADRLNDVQTAGGRIAQVQVYTVSRRPAESFVSPLNNQEVDAIVELVQARANLRAGAFYAATES